MQGNSFKVSGTRESLEGLRAALLKEPQADRLTVTDVTPEPEAATPGAVRVRQFGLEEAIFAFAIHVPAGIAAHTCYDWLRGWLRSRADAAQVRHQEVAPPPAPGGKGGTSH